MIFCSCNKIKLPGEIILEDINHDSNFMISVEGFINIKYVNYFIDTIGWDLAFIGMESDDCIEHVFEKVEMDTSKLLTACIDANNNTYVKSYRKIYIENNVKHTILFKADTFYHYTEDIENNMTFISGEYNYRAERLLFENDEFMYYLLYRDSLGKIKGNNLPKLPQPNYDEIKRFDSLFN
jgi:hypothetical protein